MLYLLIKINIHEKQLGGVIIVEPGNQRAYFDTFGFLFVKNLLTQEDSKKMLLASKKNI